MTEVHVLGIRHHGPGSARSVAEALAQISPDLVLVEGPPEFDPVLPLIGDPEMSPPIAGLVYVDSEPRRASFYPLASFSPEWVALRWAARNGADAGCIDLPDAHRFAIGAAWRAAQQEASASETEPAPGARARGAEAEGVPEDSIATLARVAGYEDPERWWEDAVEQAAGDALARFHLIAEGIALLRQGRAEPPLRAADGALMLAELADPLGDGMTALREAAMRKAIRAAIASGRQRVVVVCGAWHAPALDPARFPTAASDNRLLRGLPKVKVSAAWVPWTAARLGLASGYGAGVASPGWYRHLFEHREARASHDVAMSWLVRVGRALREQGLAASTAAVVEASRLATALAAIRGRPSPGLTELEDAALAVLADGDPLPLSLVHAELVVGRELGGVPASAPLVPLAADLARQQKALRLKPAAAAKTIVLDLRTETGLARSVLLHRLRLLGIDWGVPADAGRTTGTFKEGWTLAWEPELAVAVVEGGLFGTTVASAAQARVAERARRADSLSALSVLIDQALLADLSAGDVVQVLADRAAVQSDAADLLQAVEPLARVCRYGSVRGAATDDVRAVLDATAVRGCVGLPMAAAGIDEDSARRLRETMESAARGLALLRDSGLDERWAGALTIVAERDRVPGLVAGCAVRMLRDAGRIDALEVARRMRLRLSPALPPADAAGWLEGFLAGEAMLLIHDPALLGVVDDWLGSVAEDAFDDLLPLLRRTFSAFSRPERRQIGARVSRADAGEGVEFVFDAGRAAPAIAAVARLLGWSGQQDVFEARAEKVDGR